MPTATSAFSAVPLALGPDLASAENYTIARRSVYHATCIHGAVVGVVFIHGVRDEVVLVSDSSKVPAMGWGCRVYGRAAETGAGSLQPDSRCGLDGRVARCRS